MAAWQGWFENLGGGLVDAGNPIFNRQNVGNCDGNTMLGGYTMVNADDLDSAVAMARGCPLLQAGGGVEVGELTLLNPEIAVSTADDHSRAAGTAG